MNILVRPLEGEYTLVTGNVVRLPPKLFGLFVVDSVSIVKLS